MSAANQPLERLEEVFLPTTCITDSRASNCKSATVGQVSPSANKTLHIHINPTPTDAEPRSCDVCAAAGKSATEDARRTHHCSDCDEALCRSCAAVHRNSKMLRGHALLSLERSDAAASTAAATPADDVNGAINASRCLEHPTESQLDIFCCTCRTVICRLCRLDRHKRHHCSDDEALVNRLRNQVAAASTAVGGGRLQSAIAELESLIDSVDQEKQELANRASVVERAIADRAESLKSRVDYDRLVLASRLAFGVQTCSTRLEELRGTLSDEVASMRSLMERCVELSTVGSNGEVARESIALVKRVDELTSRVDGERRLRNRMFAIDVVFEESSLTSTDEEVENLVGDVNVEFVANVPDDERERTRVPRLVHVVPRTSTGNEGYVVGIALLDDQLLVLRCVPRLGIELYDASTFTFRRHVPISASAVQLTLDETYGMASCEFNKCVYVSEFKQFSVHRVELSCDDTGNGNEKSASSSSWSVALGPTGLHVKEINHNVLVTCRGARRIQEYTSSGTLVREICLHPDIPSPWHAIELTAGELAVSCGCAVFIVGQDGSAVTSVVHESSTSTSKVHFLTGMTQTSNGCILVANRNADVIGVFNPSLDCTLRDLTFPTENVCSRLRRPWAVYMDDSRDRLYVGEYDGGRILVFDDVDTTQA